MAERPKTALWEITHNCNFACAHCLVNANGRGGISTELTLAACARFFREFKSVGVHSVCLSGGEPLICEDLVDLMNLGHTISPFEYCIATNGYCVSDELVAHLKSAGLSYMQFKGIEETQKDEKIAVVSAKIFDKKIEKDFIVKLKMRELDNGEWCLVEVANLTEYLSEREKAVKEKLNALNKPIREQIEKAFQVVSLDINARNENSFFPMYRLHYTLKFKLPDNSKKIAQLKGLFVISDKDGKDLTYQLEENGPEITWMFAIYEMEKED